MECPASGATVESMTSAQRATGSPVLPRPRPARPADAAPMASFDALTGVCVVTVAGPLGAAALEPLRTAIDAALERAPHRVVLDLRATADPEPVTVALLGATRRYLHRRGVELTLAGLPASTRRRLREAHVDALYDVQPARPAGTGTGGSAPVQPG